MPHWNLKIDLSEHVQAWKLGELSIEELARNVVAQIKETSWRTWSPYPHTWDDTVDRLLNVTTAAEYEDAFDYIYDLADRDRVWIETH